MATFMPGPFFQHDAPLTLTYAFRDGSPCRFEQTSHPQVADDKELCTLDKTCPYADDCQSTSYMRGLRRAYGRRVAVTLAEVSSNIVVRSENLFNRDQRHRMTLRKHLYELSPTCTNDLCVSLTHGMIDGFRAFLKYYRSEHAGRISQQMTDESVEAFVSILRQIHDARDGEEAPVPLTLTMLHDEVRERAPAEGLSNEAIDALLPWLTSHATSPFACLPLRERQFGRYLGFVDVRTHSPVSPVALALLVPPRDLRHDRSATLMQGNYGYLFGAHGFQSVPFSMHDPESGGSVCAQACMIMVLTILADRGAIIHGSYDLTYLAERDATDEALRESTAFQSLTSPEIKDIKKVFRIRGINAVQVHRTLNDPHCNVSADAYSLPVRTPNYRRQTARLIDAYVSARCPVILMVSSRAWSRKDSDLGHAVVIVGVRRGTSRGALARGYVSSEVTELVVQDPGEAPFVVRPLDECLDASTAMVTDNPRGDAVVIFVADHRVTRHAKSCLKAIKSRDALAWARYIAVPSGQKDGPEAENERRLGISYDSDYEVRLLHRDDIARLYGHPSCSASVVNRKAEQHNKLDKQHRPRDWMIADALFKITRALSPAMYWCVAGSFRGKLEVLWLFKSTGSQLGSWSARIAFTKAVPKIIRRKVPS